MGICYIVSGYISNPAPAGTRWVGPLMNYSCAHSRVCLLDLQQENKHTAKMAEGQDPGQTSAKCELVSALPVMYAQENVPWSTSTYYRIFAKCDLVISPLTVSDTPTLTELSNALGSIVNWHLLGVKLGLEDHELSAIEQNHRGDNERCKHDVLSRWLRSAKLPPTWKTVTDAVQQMGEQAVASKIRAECCSSSTESADTAGMYPFVCSKPTWYRREYS